MFRRRVLGMGLGLLVAARAMAQPQLQELAVTAIAGPGWNVVAQGTRAAVSCAAGLLFFEVDTIQQTFILKSAIQLPDLCLRMEFHPTLPLLYYTMPGHWGNGDLYLADLTDISRPRISKVEGEHMINVTDLAIAGHRLYIYWGENVCTFDITDPYNPEYIAISQNLYEDCTEIEAEGNLIYGIKYVFAHECDLLVYDAANPEFLIRLNSFSGPPDYQFLSVGGGIALQADFYPGLFLFNTYPNPPYISAPFSFPNMQWPLFCTPDGRAFAQGPLGIYQYTGSSWQWLGPGHSHGISVEQNTLITNTLTGTTQLWSLQSEPAVLRDSFVYTNSVNAVSINDSLIAVTGGSTHNALIYSITDSSFLNPLSIMELSGPTKQLVFSGNYLYVLCNNDSLAIIDVSDPANPNLCGAEYLGLPTPCNLVLSHDSLLFVAGGNHIYFYSLSNPEFPTLGSTNVGTGYGYTDLFFLNNHLVANTTQFVRIFEVGSSLVLRSTITPYNNYSYFIAGHGDTLILGGNNCVQAFSIADPTSPQQLALFDWMSYKVYAAAYDGSNLIGNIGPYPSQPGTNSLAILALNLEESSVSIIANIPINESIYSGQIVLQGNMIYFAQQYSLGIYSYVTGYLGIPSEPQPSSLPSSLAFTPSPNPTNGSLRWNFSLPRSEEVALEIYNLQGAQVGQYTPGRLSPGSHSLSWFPLGLASGVYLAQLRSGEQAALQKVVYLK